MDSQTIVVRKERNIATITLNRPDRLNALTAQMTNELARAIEEIDKDDEVRAVVLTGAGSAFCAGSDFRYDKVRAGGVALEQAEEMATEGDGLKQGKLLKSPIVKVILGLQALDKPTIAMVNGAAVGGGLDLALACDMRIGSENARFMVAFTNIGLLSGTGGIWLMSRIIGLPKACEYIFTGDFIEAKEAERLGLLNKLVPSKDLERETMELAGKIAKGPPVAIRLAKLLLYKGLEVDLETAMAFSMMGTSITLRTEDHLEGIRAFAGKRPPEFKGR